MIRAKKKKIGCKFRMNQHDQKMLKWLERAEKVQKGERRRVMQGMEVRRGCKCECQCRGRCQGLHHCRDTRNKSIYTGLHLRKRGQKNRIEKKEKKIFKKKSGKEGIGRPRNHIRALEPAEWIRAERKLTFIHRRGIIRTPLTGRLPPMTHFHRRHGPRPINLLGMVINKRLHTDSTNIKDVSRGRIRRASTTLRSAANTAPTTSNALRQSRWRHGREIRFI